MATEMRRERVGTGEQEGDRRKPRELIEGKDRRGGGGGEGQMERRGGGRQEVFELSERRGGEATLRRRDVVRDGKVKLPYIGGGGSGERQEAFFSV